MSFDLLAPRASNDNYDNYDNLISIKIGLVFAHRRVRKKRTKENAFLVVTLSFGRTDAVKQVTTPKHEVVTVVIWALGRGMRLSFLRSDADIAAPCPGAGFLYAKSLQR